MPVLRRLLLFLVALGVFLTVARLQRPLVPWPEEFGPRAKWEWLEEHADDYDVLFVGSSATYYGVIPEVFDRVARERGHALKSFQFGAGGMTEIEAGYVLDRILSLEPKRLRYVYIEASGWDAKIPDDKNAYSPRRVHWHSAKHTMATLESLPKVPKPRPKPDGSEREDWRWRSAQLHGELFLRRLTAEGQGPRIAGALLGTDLEKLEPTREQLEADHGYLDLGQLEGEDWDKGSAKFRAALGEYSNTVKGIGRGNQSQLVAANFPGLERTIEQMDEVRAAGAVPIYYTAPRATALPWAYTLARAGVYPTFFGYNLPGKYPELYLPENHFDSNHLLRSGAEILSRLMAEDFVAWLESGGEARDAAHRPSVGAGPAGESPTGDAQPGGSQERERKDD